MVFDTNILIDFISSLAIIAILAWGYGIIRQRFVYRYAAPISLGMMFGLVSILQMHTPLSPVDGLIVDLRAVPVVLAGAFLGARGLAICLLIALCARFSIGGVGMQSGLVGIVAAGVLGLLWDRMTRQTSVRNGFHLLALAGAAVFSLGAGVILPDPLRTWFFEVAALPLAVMYLISVPIIGSLLERERAILLAEEVERKATLVERRSGLLRQSDFLRELANRLASETPHDRVSALLVVSLRHRKWMVAHWGPAILGHIMGGLRHRLSGMVTHGSFLGVTACGDILIPLTRQEAMDHSHLSAKFRREITERTIAVPGGQDARVGVTDRLILLKDAVSADEMGLLLEGRRTTWPLPQRTPQTPKRRATDMTRPPAISDDPHPSLFDKADALLRLRSR